jgi:hypothetical protein
VYTSGSIFSLGVALYDPFAHWRKSAAVDAVIEDMLALGSHLQTELARLLERAV